MVRVYACICVSAFVHVSLGLLTMSGRCEQASGLFQAGQYWYGFLTGSLSSSLDLLFHVFPPFNCGRHGQTALHPATWLELHLFYEWHHQAYTPRMTVCVRVRVCTVHRQQNVSPCVCDFSPVPSLFLFYFPVNSHLDYQNWVCVAVCHPSLTTVLDFYQTKSYKGRTGFPL